MLFRSQNLQSDLEEGKLGLIQPNYGPNNGSNIGIKNGNGNGTKKYPLWPGKNNLKYEIQNINNYSERNVASPYRERSEKIKEKEKEREREKEKDMERDKERDRDREKDKERDREREGEEDRERERENQRVKDNARSVIDGDVIITNVRTNYADGTNNRNNNYSSKNNNAEKYDSSGKQIRPPSSSTSFTPSSRPSSSSSSSFCSCVYLYRCLLTRFRRNKSTFFVSFTRQFRLFNRSIRHVQQMCPYNHVRLSTHSICYVLFHPLLRFSSFFCSLSLFTFFSFVYPATITLTLIHSHSQYHSHSHTQSHVCTYRSLKSDCTILFALGAIIALLFGTVQLSRYTGGGFAGQVD